MFWQNFTRLCEENGKSPSRVAADLGLANSITSSWKRGAAPQARTLKRIADYFGVSVDALTGQTAKKSASGERQLVAYYRGFSHEGRGRLLDFAESMKKSGMYEQGTTDHFLRGFNSDPR